ncbi:GNAT family N-acetyltransferase [Nocardia sp. NBC_01377]|uniref:GNAT family N-acetyltransferase n=1 Tax=Nocardia sp. NBC_01377 TaxID=2903595 RepID=UPI002F910BAF
MNRRVVLTTRRLALTTWLPSDLDELAELHSDPETMRFVGHGRPDTVDEARARLAGYLDEQDSRGWTKWRMVDCDGKMIGRAGFGEAYSRRDLAYTLLRERWGQGLATEIGVALVDWHLRHRPYGLFDDLCAHVQVGHRNSARVLEKIGFALVDQRPCKGVPCDYFELPVEADLHDELQTPQSVDADPV